MNVRNLILGEPLPKALQTGYETGQCDPRWIWLVEDNAGIPCALLVTAPAHVAVMLLRLVAKADASKYAVNALLRQSLKEMHARGYVGYIVSFNPCHTVCLELLRLIRAIGGEQSTEPSVMCYGRLDKQPVERIH